MRRRGQAYVEPVLIVLVFACVLLSAVLVSGMANRTILSTSVLFLVAGFVLGDGVVGVVTVSADDGMVSQLAELALFSVLFTDGMRVALGQLRSAWRLPGRALLLGLPLTLAVTAAFAHYFAGLPWAESLLVGAVLSPTDPVFAAAIVGREEIPYRLRNLLNVESGLNDGLALPIVVVLLAVVGPDSIHAASLTGEVLAGIGIGIGIPFVAIRLERSRHFAATAAYEPLNAFAIGLLVLGASSLTHANAFLAAFSAGVTVATMSPAIRDAFHAFGELIAELLKLAALLVFGALISPRFLAEIPLTGYVFAAVALFVARPASLAVALIGSTMHVRERVAAAWFGPKGFASVVYGLLILRSGIAPRNELFHLVALVVVASIIAHSSTDVVIARWFEPDSIDTRTTPPPPDESSSV